MTPPAGPVSTKLAVEDVWKRFGDHDVLRGVIESLPAGINLVVVSRAGPPALHPEPRLPGRNGLCYSGPAPSPRIRSF